VRVHRQRASIVIHAVVDVSASMQFGSTIPKLHVAAEFVESLAQSAQRIGDAVGMLAFDGIERTDLFFPASLRRGVGPVMANRLRACTGGPGSPAALEATAMRLSGRPGIIFLISDFHWPLDRLSATLDMLSQAYVVPLVIWDRVEIQPPAQSGPLQVRDAESAAQRTLWVRAGLRNAWRRAVAARREALNGIFRSRDIRPFYIEERFDGEALSQYFLEAHA
ncbi:MAG TPA: VWA domain-containing protein, partial [Steroidobacter sp.]|nr:VWA domain-containing protein [Steroidobacter sp.]